MDCGKQDAMSCPEELGFSASSQAWFHVNLHGFFRDVFFFFGEPIETVNGCACMSCVCFAQAAAQPQI